MGCDAIVALRDRPAASTGRARMVRRLVTGVLICATPLAGRCQTSWSDIVGGVTRSVTSALGASAPDGSTSSSRAAAAPASPAASAALSRLEPSDKALGELQPDMQCMKVDEKVDVLQKAADYAGTNAQLRLQTLLTSDFKQSDLSDSDKQMLKYLAYTTIWVPSSLETNVGKAWAVFTAKGSDAPEKTGRRTERAALQREAARLDEIRQSINGFPGDVRLVLEPDLHDGALSRVGGLVVVSSRFVSLMDENDGVRDVLFAHELSHLYKRHALKELQYQLISSAAGWNIAKKLLRHDLPSSLFSGPNPFGSVLGAVNDLLDNAKTVKELVDFMHDTQIRYNVTQEYEADACAMKWLQTMNVEPATAWKAFRGVLDDPGPSASTSYASLHPSPDNRDKNIASLLDTWKAIDNPQPAVGPDEPDASASAAGRQSAKPVAQHKKRGAPASGAS